MNYEKGSDAEFCFIFLLSSFILLRGLLTWLKRSAATERSLISP